MIYHLEKLGSRKTIPPKQTGLAQNVKSLLLCRKSQAAGKKGTQERDIWSAVTKPPEEKVKNSM